jgi:hypothetical protein
MSGEYQPAPGVRILLVEDDPDAARFMLYLEPDLIEATARYWSRYGASRYAEAFKVVRNHASGPASTTTVRAVTDHVVPQAGPAMEVGHAS